jgi:hypothetical protein
VSVLWRVRQGQQLCDAHGNLVAGAGEVVADDHAAVASHPDITRVASRFDPDAPAPADASMDIDALPEVDEVLDDADPGDEA